MKKLTMLGIGHPFVGDFSTEIVQGNHVRGWIFSHGRDRKSVVQGKSVDLGGRRIIKKKITYVNSTLFIHPHLHNFIFFPLSL